MAADGGKIEVDAQTAFNLKLMEFDKKITDLEFQIADFRRQRMSFIYETQMKNVISIAKEKEEKETHVKKR